MLLILHIDDVIACTVAGDSSLADVAWTATTCLDTNTRKETRGDDKWETIAKGGRSISLSSSLKTATQRPFSDSGGRRQTNQRSWILPVSHPPTVVHRSIASGHLPCLNPPSTLSSTNAATLAQSARDSRTNSYAIKWSPRRPTISQSPPTTTTSRPGCTRSENP